MLLADRYKTKVVLNAILKIDKMHLLLILSKIKSI